MASILYVHLDIYSLKHNPRENLKNQYKNRAQFFDTVNPFTKLQISM